MNNEERLNSFIKKLFPLINIYLEKNFTFHPSLTVISMVSIMGIVHIGLLNIYLKLCILNNY